MKANRTYLKRRDDRAEVGVGTLPVFTAMALVPPGAAPALPNPTGPPQQRAQSTGKEATQKVPPTRKAAGVSGTRNSTSADLYRAKAQVELPAGALPMDL